MTQRQAVLFDCDGVLVDSEAPLARIAAMALRDFGISAEPSDFAPFVGMGEDAYIGGVAAQYGAVFTAELKQHVYDKYVELCDAFVLTDARGTGTSCRASVCGLASGGWTQCRPGQSHGQTADPRHEEHGFDAVYGKRRPLKSRIRHISRSRQAAAASLARRLVIEDAESGVRAAKAAGIGSLD